MEEIILDMSNPEIAEAVRQFQEAAANVRWCECGAMDMNPSYWDDNEHLGCERKHHYHCSNCGGISQVG